MQKATGVDVPTSVVTSTSATNASTTTTFPLMSKRLKLEQKKTIASALELPSSATGEDLLVMVTGKLKELSHNPSDVQVVVTNSEEGESLSLQDVDGVFLHVPASSDILKTTMLLSDREASVPSLMTGSSRTSPAPSDSENDTIVSDALLLQEDEGFSLEEGNLEKVLKLMQEALLEARAKLQESQREVVDLQSKVACQQQLASEAQKLLELERAKVLELAKENEAQRTSLTSQIEALREEVKQGKTRIRELWQTNCQQLLSHDNNLFEKETEIELLDEKLHKAEMELARLKIEKLSGKLPVLQETGASGLSDIVLVPSDTRTPTCKSDVVNMGLQTHGSAASLLLPNTGVASSQQSTAGQCYELGQPTIARNTGVTWVTNSCMSFTHPLIPNRSITSTGASRHVTSTCLPTPTTQLDNNPPMCRRGKAPPIDEFTAEDRCITFDDWLPILERAAMWNGWSKEESLMQLAGHLRGRALQEWKLVGTSDKATYESAIRALRERLDPGDQALAALDFRHASQKATESVSDFVTRLERVFQTAFGRDKLSTETRDMLLYGQLQEGLLYTLIQSPTVSGSQSYRELCLAAKKEEKRLAELKKMQQYLKDINPRSESLTKGYKSITSEGYTKPKGGWNKGRPLGYQKNLKCYLCDSPNHLARDCKNRKNSSESQGRKKNPKDVDVIRTKPNSNKGKESRYAEIQIEGVPVTGLIDTGSDITIIRGDLFYHVIGKAGIQANRLQSPAHKACTYDQKPITLDGQMNMALSFGKKVLQVTVFVKLVAPDELLLSEAVCRELGIVNYHPSVKAIPRYTAGAAAGLPNAKMEEKTSSDTQTLTSHEEVVPPTLDDGATLVNEGKTAGKKEQVEVKKEVSYVKLVRAVRLPAKFSAVVPVKVDKTEGTVMVRPLNDLYGSPQVEDALIQVNEDCSSAVVIVNTNDTTCELKSGTLVGETIEAEVVSTSEEEHLFENEEDVEKGNLLKLFSVSSDGSQESVERVKWRQTQLESLLELSKLSEEEYLPLKSLLADFHGIFSLEEGERGETDLVEFEINTGEGIPKRQPVRRMPFAARKEISEQLEKMQKLGVIQTSKSPWSSPVVLVRKRDGTLRFCVDYRALNSVTKPDLFPLPRIDDLLDQLGRSRYFTTLDLAAGYWQIKVHSDSQEKTAFITHQGLYEFRVMPFGVMNAPAVFQRLMQRVLAGLKTERDKEFVSVYLDDVIIFSESLNDHVEHLRMVFSRLREASLKLNPKKCKFVCTEVDYLGHLVTPAGLKPNNRNLEAVQRFPVPTSLRQLRQFLGLTSHYRRFIMNYAKLAYPLYALTRKGARFNWTADCEVAFETLKSKLITAPVLAYPDFERSFTLETDASKQGLGAILSQVQTGNRLHPVAYASRSISAAEANYAVTDLETLAVVWAITHFRYHLYGHDVTIITDHAAVKAILGAPNLTGQHARWWTKVYGSGIKKVEIVHRSGKKNQHADALSRQPVSPALSEEMEVEVQIASINAEEADNPDSCSDISSLLAVTPNKQLSSSDDSFASEQEKDVSLQPLVKYLLNGDLPTDSTSAAKLVTRAFNFTIVDKILYYLGQKKNNVPRVVVPASLKQKLMEEYHAGVMSGHFSGPKIYQMMSKQWWWENMYRDITDFVKNCPQCAIVSGTGRKQLPPLHSIAVDHPFQIVGIDIMELPETANGNRYVIVFQDFFTKWPMVFPAPDQKAKRIAELLVKEVVPMFGVPEALLSDRGTNLLSCLMQDVCKLLGVKKLNTTANHPQCNGMVERFNRTLKTMLRKHVSRFGVQWDVYLSGILWAYRNTPHSTTGEKPSFLLYGFDCRHPTEAATLPAKLPNHTNISDYREELVLSLASARELAKKSLSKAQQVQKAGYDKHTTPCKLKVGDWIMIHFPQEETGSQRKLSRPWHGPYRVISRDDPDITAVKIFFPNEPSIQVHQSRVNKCPPSLPSDFYWYGGKRSRPGRPPILRNLQQDKKQPDEINLSEEGSSAPIKLKENQSTNNMNVKEKSDNSVNISDVKHPYNLRSQQASNKGVDHVIKRRRSGRARRRGG